MTHALNSQTWILLDSTFTSIWCQLTLICFNFVFLCQTLVPSLYSWNFAGQHLWDLALLVTDNHSIDRNLRNFYCFCTPSKLSEYWGREKYHSMQQCMVVRRTGAGRITLIQFSCHNSHVMNNEAYILMVFYTHRDQHCVNLQP